MREGGRQKRERGLVEETAVRGMEDYPCCMHTVLGSNGGDKLYRQVGSGKLCEFFLLLLL